jgi:hypothetical protein
MENTRAHPSVDGWSDPCNSKYYVTIVQYTARFNNEKLCAHLHKLNGGKVWGDGSGWDGVVGWVHGRMGRVEAELLESRDTTPTPQNPTLPPPPQIGKKWFNMRLCPEDVSDSLSGFGHNGVSPVGLAARLPIILSHRITQLRPDFFFCGARSDSRSARVTSQSLLSLFLIPSTHACNIRYSKAPCRHARTQPHTSTLDDHPINQQVAARWI